jgi:hypothetical protein
MSGDGTTPTAQELATQERLAKEAQERQAKADQDAANASSSAGDLFAKAPSRSIDSDDSDDSDSDSDSDSDDDKVIGVLDDAAKKAAKKRKKAKKKKKAEKLAKKMAKKLFKKMIKKEQQRHSPSGFYEVPYHYSQIPGNNSHDKFSSVHLGKPPHFDGTDYPK